jgi:histidine triad (HIT) family protein
MNHMSSPSDTVFTKIINGEIPCRKIYEDEKTFAFLDNSPVQPGHVLVVPKHQVEFLWDLESEDYQAVMAAAKLIAQRMRAVLGVPYVGVKVIGVDVPHAHVHLIPFTTTDQYDHKPDKSVEPDQEAQAAIAEKLAF